MQWAFEPSFVPDCLVSFLLLLASAVVEWKVLPDTRAELWKMNFKFSLNIDYNWSNGVWVGVLLYFNDLHKFKRNKLHLRCHTRIKTTTFKFTKGFYFLSSCRPGYITLSITMPFWSGWFVSETIPLSLREVAIDTASFLWLRILFEGLKLDTEKVVFIAL